MNANLYLLIVIIPLMLSVTVCPKVITLSIFYNKTSFKLHTTDNNYVQAAIHIKGRMAKRYSLIVIIP
jgi:hypothetical protein